MCCPAGQRIADMADMAHIAHMVGDALAQGGSTSYKRYVEGDSLTGLSLT
jgi:hypothetical protein